MLHEDDIQFIKDNRTQITQERLETMTLKVRSQGGTDAFTGDPIYTTNNNEVQGTVRDITSMSSGGNDIGYLDGVQVIAGDAIANFDIDVDLSNVKEVVRRGEVYIIEAVDTIGLGEDNRHHVLMRRET